MRKTMTQELEARQAAQKAEQAAKDAAKEAAKAEQEQAELQAAERRAQQGALQTKAKAGPGAAEAAIPAWKRLKAGEQRAKGRGSSAKHNS